MNISSESSSGHKLTNNHNHVDSHLDVCENPFMIVKDDYANLLSQTIRAMEDRLISMRRDRDRLLGQLRDLEDQITLAQQDVETAKTIWGRSPFSTKPVGDTKPLSEVGMTEAIKYVLQTLMQRMSPSEVRDKMAEWGFDFSSYKTDVISSIHTILKRLAERGDAQEINEGHRKKSYKWVGNAGRALGMNLASETKSPERV